jgi:hypothetical protein
MSHARVKSRAFDATMQALAQALHADAVRYLAAQVIAEPQCVAVPGIRAAPAHIGQLLAVERALISACDNGENYLLGRTAMSLLGPILHKVFLEVPGATFRFAGTVATEDGALRLARKYLANPLPARPPVHLRDYACFAFIDGAQ